MITFRATIAAIWAAVSIGSPLSAFTAADYVGDWEILILGTESTFSSGALLLEMGEEHLRGQLVWRFGGVRLIPDDGTIHIDKDGYLVVGDREPHLRVLRLGDYLEGNARDDEKIIRVYGHKARERIDLAGTWSFTARRGTDVSGLRQSWHLRLTDSLAGAYETELHDAAGHPVSVASFAGTGRSAELRFGSGEPVGGALELEFRGDRLAGNLSGSKDKVPLEGYRLRRWGNPKRLIQENSLAGWRPRDSSKKFGWSCKDGVLTNSDGDVDIVSEDEFKDFMLHLEYKVVRGGNSGVYARGQYEVQILDDHGKEAKKNGNGAIYGRFAPSVNASRPPDTWQTLDVTLIGRWITVTLNGQTVVDNRYLEGITGGARSPFKSEAGPLMLQGDHGKIWFRSITVTPGL